MGLAPGATIEWPSVTGSDGYQIQISITRTFRNLLVDEKVSSPSFNWESSKPGVFYFRVASINEEGIIGVFSSPATLRVLSKTPRIQRPQEGARISRADGNASVEIVWQPMQDVARFRLSVSRAGKKITRELPGDRNSIRLPLENAGVYSLQLEAISAEGMASKPAMRVFRVRPQANLEAPKPSKPAETDYPSQSDRKMMEFAWSKVERVGYYKFELKRTGEESLLISKSDKAASLSFLIGTGTYLWRIGVAIGRVAESNPIKFSRWHSFKIHKVGPPKAKEKKPKPKEPIAQKPPDLRRSLLWSIDLGSQNGVLENQGDEYRSKFEDFLGDYAAFELESSHSNPFGMRLSGYSQNSFDKVGNSWHGQVLFGGNLNLTNSLPDPLNLSMKVGYYQAQTQIYVDDQDLHWIKPADVGSHGLVAEFGLESVPLWVFLMDLQVASWSASKQAKQFKEQGLSGRFRLKVALFEHYTVGLSVLSREVKGDYVSDDLEGDLHYVTTSAGLLLGLRW